jgi:hypothetical protein
MFGFIEYFHSLNNNEEKVELLKIYLQNQYINIFYQTYQNQEK